MKHILGIDHLGWLVRDLDRSVALFARLGFSMSPRQAHSANMGSANHTLVLGDTYVELIGFDTNTQFNEPWRRRVAEREGLYIVSARTNDAVGALDELRAAGLSASDLVTHTRPATLPDGRIVEVIFDVVYLNEGEVAPLHVSVCRHHNPEHIFIEELAHHANTAVAIHEVHVATSDCAAAAARCAALFGCQPERRDGGFAVDASGMSIIFDSLSRLAACGVADAPSVGDAPVGVCFAVDSIPAAGAVLERNRVVCRQIGARLRVASADAAGCQVEFVERTPG